MTAWIRRSLMVVAAATAALFGLCGSALGVSVAITGPEEMVYDWTTMRCQDGDIYDGPAQAIRDPTGRIQLFASNAGARRMLGPDFDHLTHECTTRFPLPFDPNPAHYRYSNTLYGIYTENGQDVYALVHNEWHGWELPGACPAGFGKRRCGSGAVTFAVSHDAGETYVAPAPPDNLVATVPPRPVVDDTRTGLFSPTAPIKKGSYYYAMALIGGIDDQDVGVCVMRTPNIADPSSWRGWDGTSFSVRFRNNFYENVSPQRAHLCEPASYENIMQMERSITYNTYLGKYVLTGNAVKYDPALGRTVFGFYFSTSDDLVHWSMRQLIMETPSLVSHLCGGPDATSYPSLLDHDSAERNFRVTDATVYLYFVRLHYNEACQVTLDRDLVRVPLQFSQ
jgi:hypothetical protein